MSFVLLHSLPNLFYSLIYFILCACLAVRSYATGASYVWTGLGVMRIAPCGSLRAISLVNTSPSARTSPILSCVIQVRALVTIFVLCRILHACLCLFLSLSFSLIFSVSLYLSFSFSSLSLFLSYDALASIPTKPLCSILLLEFSDVMKFLTIWQATCFLWTFLKPRWRCSADS